MNEWIETADKVKIGNAYVVKLDGKTIVIYARDIHTVRDAWEIFGDPGKTRVITSNQFGDKATWKGFTEPESIIADQNGAQVRLAKE